MKVKLVPNERMIACLAEFTEGREVIEVWCKPNKTDINKQNQQRIKNLGKNTISVICLNNSISYDSIKEASIALKLDAGAISRCLSGKQKTTKGYSFKTKDIKDNK